MSVFVPSVEQCHVTKGPMLDLDSPFLPDVQWMANDVMSLYDDIL